MRLPLAVDGRTTAISRLVNLARAEWWRVPMRFCTRKTHSTQWTFPPFDPAGAPTRRSAGQMGRLEQQGIHAMGPAIQSTVPLQDAGHAGINLGRLRRVHGERSGLRGVDR